MRLTSLVTRLAAVVAGIVILAFAAGAWIVHRSAASTFRDVQRDVQMSRGVRPQRARTIAAALEAEYRRGAWPAVRAYASRPVEGLAPYLVLDLDDAVVASTYLAWERASVRRGRAGEYSVATEQSAGGRISVQEFETTSAIALGGADSPWGRLIVLPEQQPEPADTAAAFATRFWRAAAIWLGPVLAVAVAAIVLVMRRSLATIADLTRAARELQAGRVPAPLVHHGAKEFRELVSAYNAATESITRTERLRRDLISDIAHELRTPLTNLRGQVEALQRGLVTRDGDFAAILQAELRQLERLVSDVHQLALSDAGELVVHPQPLPLCETLEHLAAPLVAAVGGRLSVISSTREDVWCLADEERLRQVLGNLVENSARHRPADLVITIAVTATDNGVSFAFQDNGPGIDERDRPYIFHRFYRAEKSRSRTTGGAGLGLAIVQGLLRAMGGSIQYAAVPDAGATFVISLPAVRVQTMASSALPANERPG